MQKHGCYRKLFQLNLCGEKFTINYTEIQKITTRCVTIIMIYITL